MESEVSEPEQFWNGECRPVLRDRLRSPTTVSVLAIRHATNLQPQLTRPQPELQEIVSKPCDSEDSIDDALRAYLGLATQYKGMILPRGSWCQPELQVLDNAE